MFFAAKQNNSEQIKVYKDLTIEDEIILNKNIDDMRKQQLKLQVNVNIPAADSDVIENTSVEEYQQEQSKPVIHRDLGFTERIMNGLEDIPEPDGIVDLGNGLVFDPSNTVVVTPNMLGVSVIKHTDAESLKRMASEWVLEMESYNMTELQPLIDSFNQVGNPYGRRADTQ